MSPVTSRVLQIAEAGSTDFQLLDVEVPDPGHGHVRVVVEACGICHSDAVMLAGHVPGMRFPAVVGHELAGRVESIGDHVEGWQVGDRVAVGWWAGSCGHCEACRAGDGNNCPDRQVPGLSFQGGYADYVVVPAVGLARIPDGLTAAEAAPMGCAGVTVFDALRTSSAQPGDLVAVLGIGGLGHLGVQFAAKMGFRVAAIARGADKADLALQLGADRYLDFQAENVAEVLIQLGGAKAILATAANAEAMSVAFEGLGRRGELIAVGISADALAVSPVQLVNNMRRIRGAAAGTSLVVEETMRFAAQTGVRAWTEEASLEDTQKAFAKMLSGEARFKIVLTTGN
ncbi:alcohol dehydrogenase catalytic domain-containing protein [Amycolatopsis sp. NPDC005003]